MSKGVSVSPGPVTAAAADSVDAVDSPLARSTGELRPEILLLRGVAVLGILGYHLWQPRLPGGFAALDVFFVVSGYLVTGILVRMRERRGIDIGAYL
ncbi:MAG: hypothetical protein JF618_11575, partial [Leifsonia sp.]|nr:hypothetical protein [Leifsonia sp.]